MSDYKVELDHLAVGLTKPATKFDVPFPAFFMSILVCMLSWMLFQAVTHFTGIGVACSFLAIWLAIYCFMYFVTSRDAFGLHILWVNILYFKPHQTRKMWGNTDSYLP